MSFSVSDALEVLCKAHAQDRFAHAYLITGPEGCGKRQLVEDLARLILECPGDPLKHPDVHVLTPESKSRRIRIEAVRDLQQQLQMRSLLGGKKLGILFDADRLQEQAANAFLKTLEEPPAHSHLFLVSAFPDQLLETILSRCIEVPLQSLARPPLTAHESQLLDALADFARRSRTDLPDVFLLIRRFQELLAAAKEGIQEQNEALLKKEEAAYKQSGNKDGLEEREDYFKALTESRYIAERSRLLTILEQWWADVLRAHVAPSSEILHQPDYAQTTQALAGQLATPVLLRKFAALQELRENLNRNVQEQLSLEVGFLKVFGG
jgi:DNA polymerase-3 subunit delta'